MTFEFTVIYEIERESGKFASRDGIAEILQDAIEGADPDLFSLGPDGTSVYNVIDLTIAEVPQQRRRR